MSRAKRHAWWSTAAALGLVSAAVSAGPVPADAAVTLGQVPALPPSADCTSTADYLQPSITGGNLYIARQAGTITSWSTRSAGGGATYVFKVFRRTTDPDVFRVVAHAPPHPLTSGLNAVPVSISVRSGDMIGLNESGAPNSCTFELPGDGVLTRSGTLADGNSGSFTPLNDVRLNLSAILVPSNDFAVAAITRDRKQGSATVTVNVSNPGVILLSGEGLKKRNASKNVAVAGTVAFHLAAAGKTKRKLQKRGKVAVTPTLTFTPTNGDPASKPLTVKLLLKRRPPPSVQAP